MYTYLIGTITINFFGDEFFMAFIINTYNKYDWWDREHARKTFEINGNQYAIMEVELDWGQPMLPMRVDQEERPENFYIYDTYEDALRFVQLMKGLN